MKTFLMGMFVTVAAGALLSTSAHAQNGRYYGGYLPPHAADDNRNAALNTNGLQWALSQRGKVVGKGYSEDLVQMHLAYAAAIPGNFEDRKNYIWGARPSDGFRPGDVIQFEKCYFKWTKGNSSGTIVMEHHTAIIVGYKGDGVLTLLDQNNNGGPVTMYDLDLKWKQRGTFTVWRPIR